MRLALTLGLVLLLTLGGQGHRPAQGESIPLSGVRPSAGKVADEVNKRSIAFEENVGQVDAQAQYIVRSGGMTTYLTTTGAVFVIPLANESDSAYEPRSDALAPTAKAVAVFLTLEGANPAATLSGLDKLTGMSHYMIGNDPSQWHKGVAQFARVRYTDIYPGIDWMFYSENGELRYDFILKAGADPAAIRMKYAGMREMSLEADGSLALQLGDADHPAVMRQSAPYTYQEVSHKRTKIESRFVVAGDTVSFGLGTYDRSLPLVIDPSLLFSTFFGGLLPDAAYSVATLPDFPAVAITGFTFSANFPVTPGAFDLTQNGNRDAFVSLISPFGDNATTYLGGSGDDWGTSITILDAPIGFALIVALTGHTTSANYPLLNPEDSTLGGTQDAFFTVIAFASAGAGEFNIALQQSTYLGGSSTDAGFGIASTPAGFSSVIAPDGTRPEAETPIKAAIGDSPTFVITGRTASSDFPTTTGAFDTTFNGIQDAFMVRIDFTLSTIYSTYIGGALTDIGTGIAIDENNAAAIVGYTASSNFPRSANAADSTFNGGLVDAFVARFDHDDAFSYGTYVGGSGDDRGYGIATYFPVSLLPSGDGYVFITGETQSTNFPTSVDAIDDSANGLRDAFITLVNASTTSLPPEGIIYSSYLGSAANDIGFAVAMRTPDFFSSDPYFPTPVVTGRTGGSDFPTTQCTEDSTFNGGTDAFVTALNPFLQAYQYSTYLGGSGNDTGYGLVSVSGLHFVVGETTSANFPMDDDALDNTYNQNGDAFFALLEPGLSLFADQIGVKSAADGLFRLQQIPRTDDIVLAYGFPSDIGLVGDWDGDGDDNPGFYRPSTGFFTLSEQNVDSGTMLPTTSYNFGYGSLGDIPVVGDWDDNGFDTVGVYRPSNRTFYLRNALNGGFADETLTVHFAQAGDVPVVGDWDCDESISFGVYRPSNGTFYLTNVDAGDAFAGDIDYELPLGTPGDVPIVGDWDGDSATTVGVYSDGTFALVNSHSPGAPVSIVPFGDSGDRPLSGVWQVVDICGCVTAPVKPEVAPPFQP
jgi:hypothetical protein